MALLIRDDGTKLYWEESGSGSPLLLIQGLGWSADMWYSTVPELEDDYRVIRYDARGIGRSDVPPGPYPIELMADDAMAVLDAAGVDQAHVLGVSLGGIVAQEVALRHPSRVRSLLLGCTHPGGAETVWPEQEVLEALKNRTSSTFDEIVAAAREFGYAPGATCVEEDIRRRLELPTSNEGYEAQLMGGLTYAGATSRLPGLTIPVLVFTGDLDRMVPPKNSENMAAAIPDAKLVVVPGAGHVLFTEQPDVVGALLREFLLDVEERDGLA
jgi:pimeloyl-ACP methyl ester carboxylesterase